jgi:hypothetical protein
MNNICNKTFEVLIKALESESHGATITHGFTYPRYSGAILHRDVVLSTDNWKMLFKVRIEFFEHSQKLIKQVMPHVEVSNLNSLNSLYPEAVESSIKSFFKIFEDQGFNMY